VDVVDDEDVVEELVNVVEVLVDVVELVEVVELAAPDTKTK